MYLAFMLLKLQFSRFILQEEQLVLLLILEMVFLIQFQSTKDMLSHTLFNE